MTIGIEEAARRSQMTRYCSSRAGKKEHAKCSGYYVVSGKSPFRKLGFCECECHTRKDPNAPPRRLKDHLQSNYGVSGEGDS